MSDLGTIAQIVSIANGIAALAYTAQKVVGRVRRRHATHTAPKGNH